MDSKTLKVIEKCQSRQLMLTHNNSNYQVIITKVEGTVLYAELITMGLMNIETTVQVTVYIDDFELSGKILGIDKKNNALKLEIDQKAEAFSRRRYLRVDSLIRAHCEKIELPNGLYYFDLYVYENPQDVPQLHIQSKKFEVQLLDLSGGGVGFKTTAPFNTGDKMMIHFKDVHSIHSTVKNIKSEEFGKQFIYRVGVEYKDITDKQRELIIAKVFKMYNMKLSSSLGK